MNEVTVLLQTTACMPRLLKRLGELITSRSLSLQKGKRNDRVTFTIGGENIPRIANQPINSLGRQYTSSVSYKEVGKTILQQLSAGLAKMDSSQLPGKYKVHFTLYSRVMWPLKLCEVTMSAVSKMEAKTSSFICKWLGLPRCLSSASLYGRNSPASPDRARAEGQRGTQSHQRAF